MPVYGYTRVSTLEQAAQDRSSLEDQQRRIEGLCLANGMTLARVFREAGVSGSVPLQERPEGRELLALLQRGDTLVAAKLDRLFRSAEDALATSRMFSERGIWLVMLDMGLDPVNQTGPAKFYFGILALVAELERTTIRERLAGGTKQKRAKGGHIGGHAPFGFTVRGKGREAVLIPDERQQAAIATMRRMSGDKASLRKIREAVRARHEIDVCIATVSAVLQRNSPQSP